MSPVAFHCNAALKDGFTVVLSSNLRGEPTLPNRLLDYGGLRFALVAGLFLAERLYLLSHRMDVVTVTRNERALYS